MLTYQTTRDGVKQTVCVLTAWDGKRIEVCSPNERLASQQCTKAFNEYEHQLKMRKYGVR